LRLHSRFRITLSYMSSKKNPITSARVPLYFLIIVVLLLSSISYFYINKLEKEKKEASQHALDNIDHVSQRFIVSDKFKYIRPLAFVEYYREDTLLLSIKNDILNYINVKRSEGAITSASAYLRNLNRHQDVRINPSEVYFPGSLMKVPIMIAYLKMAEKEPGLLNKELTYLDNFTNLPHQNIKLKTLEPGKTYKISELLNYMIVYSDNQATALLSENIEFDKIAKVFEDLGLPKVDATSQEYGISLKDYSRFFRVLYNSTYLSWDMSEYGLDLLVKSKYNKGLTKKLPESVVVAHKFGERNSDGIQQMHEIGIVYVKDKNYLIGVMTKGSSIEILEEVISDISKIAYDGIMQEKQ
jgi:beta-lactamase class A